MKKYFLILILSYCVFFESFSQLKFNHPIDVNFNAHELKEEHGQIIVKAPGTTLVEDRFGNSESAIQINGVKSSYLNLGSSSHLKSRAITISLWVNIGADNFFGKGYESNPIIVVRNSEFEDFNLAYAMFYDYRMKKFSGGTSVDSVHVAHIVGKNTVKLGLWYHLVFSMNDDFISMYINGELQNKLRKGFKTQYNMLDSVLIGHSGSEKNQRYFTGTIDDVKIYNRVLNDEEIDALYHAIDPNTFRNKLNMILKISGIVLFFLLIVLMMFYRNKRQLRKQKERFELDHKISELEIKVIKAQMNPHFISNCLSAIQELIYDNQIEISVQYIAKFSLFLRKVLHYSNTSFITLSEELNMIKLNVELEELRFKNTFKVLYIISDNIDLDDVEIPALITQPFIENAIWHGLMPLAELREPTLKVVVHEKDQAVQIDIEDNGVGRSFKANTDDPLRHKGTKMIIEKIESLNRLSHYNKYELEIIDLVDNNINIGTKVRITIHNNL